MATAARPAGNVQPPVPQMWSPNAKPSDKARYATLYPAYINSNKKIEEGRRIAKENCVPDPNVKEMRDVLVSAGFNVFLEPKTYSRERIKSEAYFGRVRVQIKNDDGTPCNQELSSKKVIMNHLGQMIPKLKTRSQQKSGGGAAGGATGGGGGGAGGGKKKKGRR